MNNQQTAVVLKQLHERFSRELELGEAELPPEAKVVHRSILTQTPYEVCPALSGLHKALDDLNDHIQTLKQGEKHDTANT